MVVTAQAPARSSQVGAGRGLPWGHLHGSSGCGSPSSDGSSGGWGAARSCRALNVERDCTGWEISLLPVPRAELCLLHS